MRSDSGRHRDGQDRNGLGEWRPVHGYEGSYSVNDRGLILSLARSVRRGGGRALIGATVMSVYTDREGYERVSLSRGGKKRQFGVHQIVCAAFHGPRPNGMQAAHLNGSPADNRAENLAWKTPQQNTADKIAHGTHQAGENHPRAKLTAQQVAEIRASLSSGKAVTELAQVYGVNQTTISDIKSGRRWGVDRHTSYSIGEQSSHKPLRPFGSSSVHRPIAAIRQADTDELTAMAQHERQGI